MSEQVNLITDPSLYGSKGQGWHPKFVEYMAFIATNDIYENMPDAIKSDGKIQWEAPSNRSGGLYQYTHQHRLEWWQEKAKSEGIDVNQNQWISKTAKLIHPTSEKPCKRCGKFMFIKYLYPSHILLKRINKLFPNEIEVKVFDTILNVVSDLYETKGDIVLRNLPALLKAKNISIPELGDNLDDWLAWIEESYIPAEPSTLSPGAMSNAPDRFEGFHSFNKCCRGQADKGRSNTNLRSYTTDRRVFEYWADGDWIAADRLMGQVSSNMRDEPCADGGEGPPSPDHIGPISLGFCHRPEFHLLSKAANSAKNNRMSMWDILHLKEAEEKGITICSWYAEPVWNLLKNKVKNDEHARRLSKIMRDNQRNAMYLLGQMKTRGEYAFLSYLLELERANYNVEFNSLKAVNYLTVYDELQHSERVVKYSQEQKSRRLRIGFEALDLYSSKENRHTFLVASEQIEFKLVECIEFLNALGKENALLNESVKTAIETGFDIQLREVVSKVPNLPFKPYEHVKALLIEGMNAVATDLANMWDDDRYIRG